MEVGFLQMLDFAIKMMQLKGNNKVLDFGCGNGRFVNVFIEKGYCAFGCDISLQNRGDLFVERQGNHDSCLNGRIRNYYSGDAIPYLNEEFNAVFSYQVFEHIKDLGFYAREMHRVLMGGGGVIYSEFAASYPLVDCHTGFPLVWLFGGVKIKWLSKLYCYLCIKLGFVESKDILKMWRFQRKHLFYRSYSEMDRIFNDSGLIVRDITYARRRDRLLLDGIGTLKELYRYKFKKRKGSSIKMGLGVKIYCCCHSFLYRFMVNRVILLEKV